MAILRGGRRIGNFDIRGGISREDLKGVYDIGRDKRLSQRQGVINSETTIGRFVSNIAQGEGFARPTRYIIRIFLPNPAPLSSPQPFEESVEKSNTLNSLNGQDMARNVAMMCNKITLPSRDVNTKSHITYGPKREMPYAYSYTGTVEATFYGDKYLRQRAFFEEWQKLIFDNNSHNMRYYNDYVGEMDILQLGAFDSEHDRDRIVYGVRLYEVYPQTLGSIEYGYDATDQIVNVPITLNFRSWRNLTIDQIGNATVGSNIGKVPEIVPSKDFGIFGGILNKLPTPLKRVGSDVLNQVRRSLPIGRVTGGRVFPPFL
jgi:hypothetical protein